MLPQTQTQTQRPRVLLPHLVGCLSVLLVHCTVHAFPNSSQSVHYFNTFDNAMDNESIISAAPRTDYVWGAYPINVKLWKQHNPNVVLSAYMSYDCDTTGEPLSWWQEDHPSWVLYKCDRTTPAFGPCLSLDVSNPDVIDWQVPNLRDC
jgi:hypothetical protein